MKKEWNDVREFHEKFGHPCPDAPRMLDKKRSLSRVSVACIELTPEGELTDINMQAFKALRLGGGIFRIR